MSLLVALPGCGKLKKAAEEAAKNALGIEVLKSEDIEAMKTQAEWSDPNGVFEILFGFELTDKFKQDLGKNEEIDLTFVPSSALDGLDKSGKDQALALVRQIEFETPVKKYTRFEIVSVAKVENKKLVVGGEEIAKYLDDSQRVKKGQQAGKYLLLKGKSAGMTALSGKVELKKADASSNEAVGDALVFTDKSPFVTKSGKSTGQFLLIMLEGEKGNVNAYRKNIYSDYSAPGTPEATFIPIPYAGVIPDDKIEEASAKADAINAKLGDKVDNWATQANDKITTLLGLWKVQEADLLFVQPPQNPPPPPVLETAQKPEPPTVDKPVNPPAPNADTVVMQRPPEAEAPNPPQTDLGCAGLAQDGTTSTLITDGAQFDDYTKYKGWRAMGDVRITAEEHDMIFGAPAALEGTRYPDKLRGYCLLTTGDALYQKSLSGTEAPQLKPGPDGAGRTSEMWQKVHVPAETKSIQVRVAFFSQEFPYYVGSQFNDSFLIKFDEATEAIASGNLNALAGADISTCSSKTFETAQVECGEWKSLLGNTPLIAHGELWDIASSLQAPPYASTYKCNKTKGDKCYHGWIPPRVICKSLPADMTGKELTLRVSVSDVGDSYFDSALAVDSIVFSKEGCANDQIFSGDRRSAVSE